MVEIDKRQKDRVAKKKKTDVGTHVCWFHKNSLFFYLYG